jgi:hypothetical protein
MNLLSPNEGDIIDYKYNNEDGWIEVTNVSPTRIEFNDNFGRLRDHPVGFRWSTWKVHMELTLDNVRFRTTAHYTWEV